jgi:virulence-associated protein VagC
MGEGVLLEPRITDVRQWFAELDGYKTAFMKKGTRKQPQNPRREIFD